MKTVTSGTICDKEGESLGYWLFLLQNFMSFPRGCSDAGN